MVRLAALCYIVSVGIQAHVIAEPPTPDPKLVARMEAPFRPSILVKGEVIEIVPVTITKDLPIGKVKITHVYLGPGELLGTTVDDRTGNGGNAQFLAIPLLEVGEEGVWVLEKTPGRLYVHGRIRKSMEPRYQQLIEWAEAAGKMDQVPSAEKLRFAKELCTHTTSEVARFGAETLHVHESAEAIAILKSLVLDTFVPPEAQIAIDRALYVRVGREWMGSVDRLLMMTGWMTGKHDDHNFIWSAKYLSTRASVRAGPFEPATAVKLIVMGISNRQLTIAARIEGCNILSRTTQVTGWTNEAFNGLVNVIQSPVDRALRLHAASILNKAYHLSDPHYRKKRPLMSDRHKLILRELVSHEKDAEVGKQLTEAMKPPIDVH